MKRKSNLVDPYSHLRLPQMMWKWKGTLFNGKRTQYGVGRRDEDRQEQRIMTVYENVVMKPITWCAKLKINKNCGQY